MVSHGNAKAERGGGWLSRGYASVCLLGSHVLFALHVMDRADLCEIAPWETVISRISNPEVPETNVDGAIGGHRNSKVRLVSTTAP